ncbi:MAG: serine/threonine-protein kinase [Dehalococcoidia bacterium]
MSTQTDLFAGRYRLEAALGRGTFGTVQRAFDTRLKRHVAIKMPHRLLASDEEFIQSFMEEAQTAAALNHPNIVTIYDVGETEDGLPYLAMRFLEGRSLRQLLIEEQGLAQERALTILDQLAAALDHLQAQRLVHRDIKPANVMVGAHDETTLMDFGLARVLLGTHLSLSGVLAFTPLYASPEQITGERLTPASDRYSFAVIAYEALTGKAPHANFDSQLLFHAIRFEPPIPAEEINHTLTPEAGRVLKMALAKNPAERPDSARSIIRDLRTALSSRIATTPPVAPARIQPRVPNSQAHDPSVADPSAPHSTLTPPPPATPPSSPDEGLPRGHNPRGAPSPLAAETVVQANWRPPEPVTRLSAGLNPLAPAETVVQPGWQPPAAPVAPPPVTPTTTGWSQRTPLPSRIQSELARYAVAGIERVEIFGRSSQVCQACAAARSRSYPLDMAPELPLPDCTSAWGCHCEYAPLPEKQQVVPQDLIAALNSGQRSRLDLLRLRYTCARGEAQQVEIVCGPDACPVCAAAAHAYDPDAVPTLPLYGCRRYPPCECTYQLRQTVAPPAASLSDAIRRLDANLKRKGWPWQWH